MTRWIRLGLRLSLGSGRPGLVRTVLMGTGSAIGTLMVLAALSGAAVAGAQRDVELARAHIDGDTPGGVASLRLAERYDAVGGRVLYRVAVAGATPDSPRPPGVADYPGPGEVVVSPALADLIRIDERARGRFPQPIVGEIGPAGLLAPDELYAYVGVAADDPYLAGHPAVLQFRTGTTPWTVGPGLVDAITPERVAALAFALFVLVPFGVFLATCARLSATTRDRRIAALRLISVSARQAALINAVETGVVALVGSLLGYGLFRALGPWSQSWHVGRLHWWAADLALPVVTVVVVLALVVAFALAVGVAAGRPARRAPLRVSRQAPSRRPSPWRLAPFVTGLALAAVAAGLSTDSALPLVLLGGAVVVTGLGLPLALAPLSRALAGAAPRLPRRSVTLELAAARLRHSPGVAPRLVGALAVAVYVIGMGSLGTALYEQRIGPPTRPSPVYQFAATDPALVATVRGLPDVEVADIGSTGATVDGEYRGVLLTDCADLAVMFTVDTRYPCQDGLTYRLGWDDEGLVPVGSGFATEAGWSGVAPERFLWLGFRYGIGYSAGLLVTRAAPEAAGLTIPYQSASVVAATGETFDRVLQLLAARAPAASLIGHTDVSRGLDPTLLATLLTVGLTVSLGLGVATFVVACADRRVERRRETTTLAVVGASTRVTVGGEIAFGAVPLGLGLLLATGATIAIALSLARLLAVETDTVVDIVAPALALGGVTLVTGLVLVTLPALVPVRVAASALRRP